MSLLMIGCSYKEGRLETLEKLAFSPDQTRLALSGLHRRFPSCETAILSTCNRVELYFAANGQFEDQLPTAAEVADFLAAFHNLSAEQLTQRLVTLRGADAVRRLFRVVASLDSMVVGEAQIAAQVKTAYELATESATAGQELHAAFQAAIRAAKRVASETELHRRRVSIPSVAVADFAKAIFERFDNKRVLLIGAGEMGEETLQYLVAEGAREIAIVNRNLPRAEDLARRLGGAAHDWSKLADILAEADVVVSTTGAPEPIVSLADYRAIERRRGQRTLFALDLAIPRDFDPAIAERPGVYLYSLADLEAACRQNLEARRQHLPAAEQIVQEETVRYLAEAAHRESGATIRRLKEQAAALRDEELDRLTGKLGDIDPRQQEEIARSFDRLINKLLHPPLESLRDEARQGGGGGLLAALKKLFQLKE